MKQNIIKLSAIAAAIMLMASGSVAYAAGNWTKEVSTTTPNWGGVKYNNSVYDAKDTNSGVGSFYATQQTTWFKHEIALTYTNTSGKKVIGSDWDKAEIDVIKHPNLVTAIPNMAYYSAAKSAALEPADNTVVKYKFSADKL